MPKKKKHIVLARTPEIMEQGIDTPRGHKGFNGHSVMWVNDAGEAREIEQKYKGKVAVTEDQQYSWSVNNDGGNGTRMDNVHNYTFSGVDTSHFKVWVLKRGKLVRVTKAQAQNKGYKIVASTKQRPDISQLRNAEGAPAEGGRYNHGSDTQ